MILWLVGMMGSGKTTVGRILADSMRRPFVDTDDEVEALRGARIREIWETSGERGFRRLESAVVSMLSRAGDRVVATGGGVVLDPANRAHMRSTGNTVWLRAGAGHLASNLREDEARPLLDSSSDPRQTLARMAAARSDIYRSMADQIVDVDRRSPSSVAAEIGASWWN